MINDIEKKYPGSPDGSGFLNADDAPFSLGINEWVNMENCRVGSTDDGMVNTVESIGSNILRSTALPSVTFLTIGSAEDVAKRRFFVFKFNTTGTNHKITCYTKTTLTELDVLLSSQVTGGLNFSKNKLIVAEVVDDILYWTDNNNEVRKLNVEAALKLNNPSYSTSVTPYTTPIAQSVIKLIRKPPGTAPTATKGTDGAVTTNYLGGIAGSFAFRYRGRDNEETVFGPPSAILNYNLPTDTFNKIDIIFGIGTGATREQIPQDAQEVHLGFRKANTNSYEIIKTWSKSVTSEAQEISDYNSGLANLSFSYYGDFTGEFVSEADSLKPADSIPLRAKGLSVANNRLFLANYVKGYDTPNQTSLAGTPTLSAGATSTVNVFRPFSTYQIGIRFRDEEKRQSAVVTNDGLVISIQGRAYDDSAAYTTAIAWTISNLNALVEIPDWAYFYDILITKCLQTRFFIQSKSPNTRYAVRNSDGTYTYQTNYSSSIYALALDASLLYNSGQGYSFQEGDMANVIVISNNYYLQVIGQDANYILVKPEDLGDLSTATLGNQSTMFDVFRPYKKAGNEYFYTTGQSYNVLNPGTSSRTYSTLSGSIPGDCFRIRRLFTGSTYYFTDCMSPNDLYWKDWLQIYGEFNIESQLGQVNKKRFIQWSDVQIDGTKVNGLSSFGALSEKALPDELEEIQGIVLTSKVQNQQGNVMLAVGVSETASLYLGETQQYGSSEQTTLTLSTDVIGSVNVLKGSYGTINPEGIVEFRGAVFWPDAINGKIIQYFGNGLFAISEYKMTRFWKQWFRQFLSMTSDEIEALGNRPFIFMTVDPRHEELLISLPKLSSTPPKGYLPDYPSTIYPFDILDMQAKVIVYQLNLGAGRPRFLGAHTYYTEWFITLLNDLYTSKNGLIWEHNQTTSTNSFYGTQYTSKIMPVSNQEQGVPKVYNVTSVEANMKPYFVYFYNDYPYQQSTDLVDFDPNWKQQEGIFSAALYKNKLVPTATGYNTNGLLTGEKMRGVTMFAMFEFNPTTTFLELKNLNFGYIKSVGNVNV